MYKFVKPIYVIRQRGATLSNHLLEGWQTEMNVQLQFFDNLLFICRSSDCTDAQADLCLCCSCATKSVNIKMKNSVLKEWFYRSKIFYGQGESFSPFISFPIFRIITVIY